MVHSNRVEFGVFWIRREEKERRTPKRSGKRREVWTRREENKKKESGQNRDIFLCAKK